MPAFLAKGQTYDGANPLLDFYFLRNGFLADVYQLQYEIWKQNVIDGRLTQVGTGRSSVDVSNVYPASGAGKLGTGRYFANWTVPATEDTGPHEIRWFYKETASDAEHRVVIPFEVVAVARMSRGLCLIQDLRDEGVSEDVTDARILLGIDYATTTIERITQRWFEPRYLVQTVDGNGGTVLLLNEPIIGIESTKVAYDGNFTPVAELDHVAYRVYARHLDGLRNPDDRSSPKMEMVGDPLLITLFEYGSSWYQGSRNVEVRGVFGYTDYDGVTPWGRTPALIRDVAISLALKRLGLRASASTSGGSSTSTGPTTPVIREKTVDQEIEYAAPQVPKVASGALTGDASIDALLESFKRPPRARGV